MDKKNFSEWNLDRNKKKQKNCNFYTIANLLQYSFSFLSTNFTSKWSDSKIWEMLKTLAIVFEVKVNGW